MNKNVFTALFLLFVSIMATSCTDSDFTDLPNQYEYRNAGPGYAYIFNADYDNDYRDEAGRYVYAPTHEKYYESLIPCNVEDYAYDEHFIIAYQTHNPNCFDDAIRQDELKLGRSSNFWIVVEDSRKTIGPLSLEEYRIKRQELQIPDNLKLDEE